MTYDDPALVLEITPLKSILLPWWSFLETASLLWWIYGIARVMTMWGLPSAVCHFWIFQIGPFYGRYPQKYKSKLQILFIPKLPIDISPTLSWPYLLGSNGGLHQTPSLEQRLNIVLFGVWLSYYDWLRHYRYIRYWNICHTFIAKTSLPLGNKQHLLGFKKNCSSGIYVVLNNVLHAEGVCQMVRFQLCTFRNNHFDKMTLVTMWVPMLTQSVYNTLKWNK